MSKIKEEEGEEMRRLKDKRNEIFLTKKIFIVSVAFLWCLLTIYQCIEIHNKREILYHMNRQRNEGYIQVIPVAGFYKVGNDRHFLYAGDKVYFKWKQYYEIEKSPPEGREH